MAKSINKTGRSKSTDRFFPVHHYILKSSAWRRLSVNAKAAWLQIGAVYNGSNNGGIAMSCRRLGNELNISKDSAARAISELVTAGFLEIAKASSFSGKRKAAEYRFTHFRCDRTGETPSRAFQNAAVPAVRQPPENRPYSPCGETT